MSNAESSTKSEKRYWKVPWIFSTITGIFWGLSFLYLSKLHDMWTIFEGTYPLFIANLFGIAATRLSSAQVALFALLDGAVGGWLLGWLFAVLLRRMPSSVEI